MTTYERVGDQYRCPRHDRLFGDTSGCEQCDIDPGEPPSVVKLEPLPKPPKGCRSSEQLERELTSELGLIKTVARHYAAAKVRTTKVGATVAKLYDTWLKGTRLQIELAQNREDAEIVRRQEERDREREANRGAN